MRRTMGCIPKDTSSISIYTKWRKKFLMVFLFFIVFNLTPRDDHHHRIFNILLRSLFRFNLYITISCFLCLFMISIIDTLLCQEFLCYNFFSSSSVVLKKLTAHMIVWCGVVYTMIITISSCAADIKKRTIFT